MSSIAEYFMHRNQVVGMLSAVPAPWVPSNRASLEELQKMEAERMAQEELWQKRRKTGLVVDLAEKMLVESHGSLSISSAFEAATLFVEEVERRFEQPVGAAAEATA